MTTIKDLGTSVYGTITYNGYTFHGLTKATIEGRPRYDRAERTVTCIVYRLRVDTIVYGATLAAQQTNMKAVQDALTQAGKTLIIEDIGFDTDINTSRGNPRADMLWGAKPRMIACDPWGGQLAWHVVWECDFHMSRCVSSSQSFPLMAFNYDIVYAVNDEHLTTRTITGYVEIPISRGVASRQILDNVDEKWDRLTFNTPPGFRRGPRIRRIDEAKNRLEFSVTDIELDGDPYPAGIVKADLEYSIESTGHGFAQLIGTLQGTMTTAKSVHPSVAGQKFFAILAQKAVDLQKVTQSSTRGIIVPLRFKFAHKLFTRSSYFSVQYMMVTCLHEILTSTGLWAPVPGSDYSQWAASMRTPWSNRGSAGLKWNNTEDMIVDVCASFPGATLGKDAGSYKTLSGSIKAGLDCQAINPARSYLKYQNDIKAILEQQSVLHRFAQRYLPEANPSYSSSWTQHIRQYQSAPDQFILMTGSAIRLQYKPEPPRLVSVGGAAVRQLAVNYDIPDTPFLSFFDCPLYKGRWAVLYELLEPARGTNALFSGPRPTPNECV